MATACLLHWVPDSLYNYALSTIVVHYSKYRSELRLFPDNVQFDVYYMVSKFSRTGDEKLLKFQLHYRLLFDELKPIALQSIQN